MWKSSSPSPFGTAHFSRYAILPNTFVSGALRLCFLNFLSYLKNVR